MSTPKRQHIIPCLHLRHFAGKDPPGQVWNYDAIAGKVWSATAENTAVEGHFYSGEMPDGSMNTAIEEHLAKAENSAVPVYQSLLQGQIPEENQQRADFAHFLGLMYSRTRAMRRVAAEMYGRFMQIQLYATARHSEVFDSSIRRYEKELGRKLTPEEREGARKGMIDPSNYEFTVGKELTLYALTSADELTPLFFKMKWHVMSAVDGFLISSDNPLVKVADPKSVSPFYGDGGFANETIEVTFPLSPSKLLLMTWKDAKLRPILTREAVRQANKARAVWSEQFLYAHVRSPEIEQLAAQYRDSRPGFTTQGFGPEKFGKIKLERRRGPAAHSPKRRRPS